MRRRILMMWTNVNDVIKPGLRQVGTNIFQSGSFFKGFKVSRGQVKKSIISVWSKLCPEPSHVFG